MGELGNVSSIRTAMEKNQYLLKSQYALNIVEAKCKIIDEEMRMKYGREITRSITQRIKTPESIYAKLVRKNLQTDFKTACDKLNDLLGVRVVCLFVDDVYELAKLLKQQKDVKIIKEKDYIAAPKKNGYMSLHLIIEIPIYFDENCEKKRVEIQIRTATMDCWSVLDYQLCYKKNMADTAGIMEKLKRHSDTIAAIDREMLTIRNEIEKI